jgi:outer membrane protein TolC
MTSRCIPVIVGVVTFLILPMSSRVHAQQPSPTPDAAVHLSLAAAVDMALAHNHKVQLARLSVRDNQEQKRIAQSHYYPVLKDESEVHYITELEGIVLPEGALSHGTAAGPVPAQTVRIDQGASASYTSITELAQPLTQMFRIRAGVRAADADLASSRIEAGDTTNAIALQVHQLYYSYLIEQLEVSAAQDAAAAASTTETENQQGLQEGRLLADAELASRATLLEDQRSVLVAKLNLDDLTLQLDDVLGLAMGTRLQLDPDALGNSPQLPSRDDAFTAVLRQNPSVLAAQQSVEKARAGVAAAHDAYIPDVTGFARYDYQSGLPFLEHNFGSFGANVSYTLFDGGAREASIRDANVKLSMAQTQLAQTQDDARVEISAAYDKMQTLVELVKVSSLTLEAREETLRVQTQRAGVEAELASGIAGARAQTTSAKASVLEAKLNLYLAQNNILKLLGQLPR